MALPINTTPTYELTIPSTGKTVKYRPFLVKDEKALLLAQQSEDTNVMINTLQDVIRSCIKDDVSVDSFAMFDIEYIFTQIRAKSVGEEVELVLKCQHCDDTNAKVQIKIDLTKLEVYKDPEHTNKIHLFDNVGIVMKYPNVSTVKKLESINANSIEDIFSIVSKCVDYIYDADQIYYANEMDSKELDEFISNLTNIQFEKIQKFFGTMPVMKRDIEYKCPVCGAENNLTLSGMSSFF